MYICKKFTNVNNNNNNNNKNYYCDRSLFISKFETTNVAK